MAIDEDTVLRRVVQKFCRDTDMDFPLNPAELSAVIGRMRDVGFDYPEDVE